jgi:hypothetical protein
MENKSINRVTICITVDPDIQEWLKIEATERRSSVSQVVRDLISQTMKTKIQK